MCSTTSAGLCRDAYHFPCERSAASTPPLTFNAYRENLNGGSAAPLIGNQGNITIGPPVDKVLIPIAAALGFQLVPGPGGARKSGVAAGCLQALRGDSRHWRPNDAGLHIQQGNTSAIRLELNATNHDGSVRRKGQLGPHLLALSGGWTRRPASLRDFRKSSDAA